MSDGRYREAQDVMRVMTGRKARTAYLGNGSGEVRLRDGSGRYYVREMQAGGSFGSPYPLYANPNANLPVIEGTPIVLSYNEFDQLWINRVYIEGFSDIGANALQTNPLDPAIYGQASNFDLQMFKCVRHPDTANKPLWCVVFPGYFRLLRGTSVLLPNGAERDLSSHIPAAGSKRVLVVYVKTDGTLESFHSTSKNFNDPIEVADVDECHSQATVGSMEVAAWVVQDGQTLLSPYPTWDLRQWMNAPPLLRVREVDSTPDVLGVTTLVVTNGTLTDDSDGQVTITTGGGGGGSGVNRPVLWWTGV